MEGNPRQKGLAPFASIEDLSDGEGESPPGKHRLALPGIKEDSAPGGPRGCAPPRIDISRASSSSHHDDSSPERELFAGGESGTGSGAKLGLGFTEEMAQELRSSTEELDYHGPPETETKQRRKKLTQQHAVTKYELEAQSEKERKDSACSEIALLSISGRTSRLSSIGSGGSAASGVSGVSHVSGGSHLSAVSQLSKTSRCSSPHRTLLETSFCGPKPIPTLSLETEYPPRESVEAALLARNVDPAGAILPVEEVGVVINGAHVVQKQQPQPEQDIKETKKHHEVTVPKETRKEEPKQEKQIRRHEHQDKPVITIEKPATQKPKLKPKRRPKPVLENELQRIIPLHSEDSLEDDSIDQPEEMKDASPSHSTSTSHYMPENGIYIPLKGPDPMPVLQKKQQQMEEELARKIEIQRKKKEIERLKKIEIERFKKAEQDRHRKKDVERSSSRNRNDNLDKFNRNLNSDYSYTKTKQSRTDDDELFKIIPLHGDTPPRRLSLGNNENCDFTQFAPWNENGTSVKPMIGDQDLIKTATNRIKPATLDLNVNKPAGTLDLGRPSRVGSSSVGREESRTPSPATSIGRGSLFRRSSESSSSTKSRTSYSAESKSKKDSRNKSVFSSLFKKGGSAREKERSRDDIAGTTARRRRSGDYDSRHSGLDPKITNVEFTFKQDRGGSRNTGPDSIVIPLHSPDSVVEPLMVYDPETETMVDMHLEEEPRVRLPQTMIEPMREQTTVDSAAPESDSTFSKPIESCLRQQQSSSTESKKAIIVSADVITHSEPNEKTHKRADKKIEKTTPTTSVAVSPKSPRTTPTSSMISPRSPKTTPTSSVISPGSSQRSQLKESSPGSGELLPEVLKLLPPEMMAKSPESSKEGSIRNGKERLSGGSDERKNSSESEQDSDAVLIPNEERLVGEGEEEDDQEKKTLVHQPDSLEDELPYVPTTLPQERSVAHPIIPIKQRVSEVKTYPIERPRSTTPINPATLDDYVTPYDEAVQAWDKMQITLPRTDSVKSEGRPKSPGRGKPRSQFPSKGLPHPTEKGRRALSGQSPQGHESRRKTPPTPPSPPPLPPRATTAWVSFDEVPERRRTPKRITTLPSSTQQHVPASSTTYNYVNPEECSCECHETQHRSGATNTATAGSSTSNQCGIGSDGKQHKSYSKTRTSSASYRTN